MAEPLPYILADDLTGACDAALPFRERFAEVRICAGFGAREGALCAVNTASRALSPQKAAARAARAVREAAARGGRLLLKKVDSTLRGHLGPEIAAVARAGGYDRVVFCPAFPAQGRTVVGGVLRVEGTPLSRARLFEGGRASRLPDRPAEALGSGFCTAEVGLEAVRGGAEALRLAIGEAPSGTVVFVDAETEEDLDALAGAVEGQARWLCAGAAGWARAMARRLPRTVSASAGPRPLGRPALFLIGSLNPRSRDQARLLAQEEGVKLFRAEFGARMADPEDLKAHMEQLGNLVGGYLQTVGARAAVVLSDPPRVGRSKLPGDAGEVARSFARLGAARLWRKDVGGLLFCGGDVAQAAWEELGPEAFLLEGELLPGIARCRLAGGRYDGLSVVTKPGGFGGSDALSRILALWRGGEGAGGRAGG